MVGEHGPAGDVALGHQKGRNGVGNDPIICVGISEYMKSNMDESILLDQTLDALVKGEGERKKKIYYFSNGKLDQIADEQNGREGENIE